MQDLADQAAETLPLIIPVADMAEAIRPQKMAGPIRIGQVIAIQAPVQMVGIIQEIVIAEVINRHLDLQDLTHLVQEETLLE